MDFARVGNHMMVNSEFTLALISKRDSHNRGEIHYENHHEKHHENHHHEQKHRQAHRQEHSIGINRGIPRTTTVAAERTRANNVPSPPVGANKRALYVNESAPKLFVSCLNYNSKKELNPIAIVDAFIIRKTPITSIECPSENDIRSPSERYLDIIS